MLKLISGFNKVREMVRIDTGMADQCPVTAIDRQVAPDNRFVDTTAIQYSHGTGYFFTIQFAHLVANIGDCRSDLVWLCYLAAKSCNCPDRLISNDHPCDFTGSQVTKGRNHLIM